MVVSFPLPDVFNPAVGAPSSGREARYRTTNASWRFLPFV